MIIWVNYAKIKYVYNKSKKINFGWLVTIETLVNIILKNASILKFFNKEQKQVQHIYKPKGVEQDFRQEKK